MSRGKSSWVLGGIMIMLLTAGQSAIGSGSAGQFRVSIFSGAGTPDFDTVNSTINDFSYYLRQGRYLPSYTYDYFNKDEFDENRVFGGRIEYFLRDNLAIGTELMPLSAEGGFDYGYTADYGRVRTESGNLSYNGTTKLLSMYGLYLIPMGTTPVSLRLQAGVGYMMGATLTIDADGEYTWDSGNPIPWSESLEATGSNLAFHVTLGAEFEVTDHLLLCADAIYRSADSEALEVRSVDADEFGWFDDVHEGGTLKWRGFEFVGDQWFYELTTDEEEGLEMFLDFCGFYLTVSAAFTLGP